MDSSILTSDNYMQFKEDSEGNQWDFKSFNPEHFRHIESCIMELQKRQIEADIILMHPYDRWGFSKMNADENRLYLEYVTARMAACRNVWWSLANEYDLCRHKSLEDWEALCRGGYAGHGETYLNDTRKLWWSHGGKFHGESWKRFKFLHQILSETPGHGLTADLRNWNCMLAVPECEKMLPVKSYYLYYFSYMRPSFQQFYIDDTTEYQVEVIDTWNMTIEAVGTFKGRFVMLPRREYMAVRLKMNK